jgi:hypothetical protein
MDQLNPEEIKLFSKILKLSEQELSATHYLAIRLLVSDAVMQLKYPEYQTALSKEQILKMFPSKET